jgi:hypothetical protein
MIDLGHGDDESTHQTPCPVPAVGIGPTQPRATRLVEVNTADALSDRLKADA